MYIIDDIAYAGNKIESPRVTGVRALSDWRLWVRFNNSEAKIYDFKPLLDFPAFQPLKDEQLFKSCYIDFGGVMWADGSIDIAPDELYNGGESVTNKNIA